MSSSKLEDLVDLCRFCLEKTENIHLVKEIDSNTMEILTFSLNFKVTETFTSLTNFCAKCKENIDNFSNWLRTARETQSELEKTRENELLSRNSPDEPDSHEAEPTRRPADFTYDNVMLSIKRAESARPRDLNCLGCGFVGINLKALISHVSVAHRRFKGKWCAKCNGLFDDLRAHRRTHDAGDLTCRFCFKSFTIARYLVRHLLSHTGDGSKAKRVRNGEKRSSPRDGVGASGKLCNVCGKQFSNGSKLLAHLRSHTNEAPFSCTVCNKRLKTSSHLRQHENVHRELRPYQCGTCNKSFNQSSTLRTHSKLHGEKDHRCSMCEKAFCRLSDLKVHLRTHTGEKPFRCGVCDVAFVQRSHLTEHEKKHLDVKPYKCVYCDKSFTQKSTLKSHIDIHLGVKSYQCSYCPYAARQSYVLKTHMKQHEKDFVAEIGQRVGWSCALHRGGFEEVRRGGGRATLRREEKRPEIIYFVSKCSLEMEPPGPDMLDFPNNPLLCPICHDYFTEPCILSCYHTFCARCLRGRDQDRKLICPYCRQPTILKDGTSLPPPDTLMRQLIDIANSENPPCSNCDKRDRASMYYCNTCGQALCSGCRDNTHRAKMFSAHEVVHMSKCTKEPKRCPQHGEQYIMYSPLQHTMLCVNCFRDTPNEIRAQCLDIDTAHTQAAKRLERGQNAIMDLQTSVRDGILALKGLMDELRRNMDSEKHTINTFCQGMQEAMAKTHAAMIMEVQRQYESKDRIYRSQLLLLGSVMPVLQLHLVLCTTFTSAANKYQFLELCPSLIERLLAVGQLSQPVRSLQSSSIKTNYRSEFAQSLEPWIGPQAVSQHAAELAAASRVFDGGPPPTKKQHNLLKTKVLEAESSFASHCRSFESQIRELNQQFNTVKDKVSELHKDITAIRKAQNPPLINRYEVLTRECGVLEASLERQQQELDRMAAVFDAAWEEQLWRIRVEQEVFSCQRADVMTLRNELKHLSNVAAQLEPYIRSLTPAQSEQAAEQALHLQSLLEHIGRIHQSEQNLGKIPRSRSRVLGNFFDKVRPSSSVGHHERERSKSAGQTDKPVGQKAKKSTQQQQLNMERLEMQIKEKLQDIMRRRQSQQVHASKSDTETERKLTKDDRKLSKTDLEQIAKLGTKKIVYKKIGKSCERINSCSKLELSKKPDVATAADYQRIPDTTKALVHSEVRSTPGSPKCKNKAKLTPKHRKPKVYPYSDGEDNVFYSVNDSADSLSTSSRRSSFESPDKTLVVVINRRNKNLTLAQKQRSWETFPPKRKHHVCQKLSAPAPMPLRKTDSFEGHEEAVKSLVAAVQETRRKPKGN